MASPDIGLAGSYDYRLVVLSVVVGKLRADPLATYPSSNGNYLPLRLPHRGEFFETRVNRRPSSVSFRKRLPTFFATLKRQKVRVIMKEEVGEFVLTIGDSGIEERANLVGGRLRLPVGKAPELL